MVLARDLQVTSWRADRTESYMMRAKTLWCTCIRGFKDMTVNHGLPFLSLMTVGR